MEVGRAGCMRTVAVLGGVEICARAARRLPGLELAPGAAG
ncbi:hypothetical protein SFUMM280S_00387 [Streptomyces fumanus]